MPPYQTTPFKETPRLLIPGTPFYLLGSYNDRVSPTLGYIISNSAVTTTGTVTFQIVSGNIPIVGALITVRGASNSANFNVTNGTILSVVANADTGVVTVTYAIASTTQATLADHGEVSIPQPEIGETLLNGASAPVAVSSNAPQVNQGKSLTVNVSFPIAPTSTTVALQGANIDLDSEYVTIATIVSAANTAASFQTGQGTAGTVAGVNLINYRFYRLLVSGTTGSGSIVGKIEG